MDNQKEAMKKSIEIFEKYFRWHVIKTLGGGSIEVIEGKQDKKSLKMDMEYGIDWIYIDPDGIEKNFGGRIQWDHDYGTFTIRKERETGAKTELEKRMEARDKDHYTFQGYFDLARKEILSYAIVKTNDILSMIDKGYCNVLKTKDEQIGQAWFYVINWGAIKSENFPITIINGYEIDYREKRLEGFF